MYWNRPETARFLPLGSPALKSRAFCRLFAARGGGRVGSGRRSRGIIFNCVSSIVMAEAKLLRIRKLRATGSARAAGPSRRARSGSCGLPKGVWRPWLGVGPCSMRCRSPFFLFTPPTTHPHAHHNPPKLSLSLSTYIPRPRSCPVGVAPFRAVQNVVCHICKSALQSFSIRVKSVSMSASTSMR